MLEGEIALKQERTTEAVAALQEARKLSDVWLARFDLGVAFVRAGHYAEAVRELELCLKRHGEATAMFLDDVPTYRYIVPLYYWLARAQEGLGFPRRPLPLQDLPRAPVRRDERPTRRGREAPRIECGSDHALTFGQT